MRYRVKEPVIFTGKTDEFEYIGVKRVGGVDIYDFVVLMLLFIGLACVLYPIVFMHKEEINAALCFLEQSDNMLTVGLCILVPTLVYCLISRNKENDEED
jgi:hypothetical protein